MNGISEINPENNFRDLGGIKTEDGRQIRHGLLYRSGGLYFLNEEELAYVKRLGLRKIIDLRAWYEVKRKPDPEIPGAVQLQHSGVVSHGGEQIDFSPSGMEKQGKEGKEQLEKLQYYYKEMPFDNGAFRVLMKAVENREVPLLFHCASGKDRTGAAAMVVEKALGVSDEAALQDYLLSNEYRKEVIAEKLKEHKDLMKQDASYAMLQHMRFGVRKEIGEILLHEMNTRYGSIQAYFEREYGLDLKDLDNMRAYYLETCMD